MNAEPISFPVPVSEIPEKGRRYRVEADAQQRAALAALLGIPAVEALAADVEIRPASAGGFGVRGAVQATVVQTDVVTLEPVTQEVAEEIDLILLPAAHAGRRARPADAALEPEAEDEADVFHNGRIDLGVIMREHLALGLDPYPRASGAEFAGHIEDDPGSDPSPFASLAALKREGG